MKCKGKKISKAKEISLLAAFSLFAAGAGVCAANTQKISYGGTAYAASESLQGNAFTFKPGASVRADEVKVDDVKVTGIRFEAEIGKEKYNALIDEKTNGFKENCEAGMIIVPADVLTKWESQKDAEGGKADIFEYIKRLGVDSSVSVSFLPENAEEKENNYLLRGVVNIKESNYLYDYQAAAYLKTDGAIVYDAFSTPRSLAYVANAAMLSDQETEGKKTLLAEKLAKIVGMKFEKTGYTLGENAASLAISDLNAKINLADYFADITAEDLTFKLESGDKIANLSGTELTFNNIGEAAVKVTAYNGKFAYTVKINATNEKISELYTKISAGNSVKTKAYLEAETNDAVLQFSHYQARTGDFSRIGVKFNVAKIKENMSDGNFVKFQLKYDEPETAEGAVKKLWMSYNYYNSNGSTSNVQVSDYHWAHVYYYDANGVAGKRGDGAQFTDDGAMRAGEWYTYYVEIKNVSVGTFFYLCFYQYDKEQTDVTIPEFTGYIKNIEYVEKDAIGAAQAALKAQTVVGNKVTPVYGMDGNDATVTLSVSAHFKHGGAWQQAGLQFKAKDNIGENNWIKLSFKIDGSTNVSTGVFFNAGGTLVWFGDVNWYTYNNAYCVNAEGNKVLTSEIVADQWYTIYYKITAKSKEPNEYYIAFYDTTSTEANPSTATVTATVKNIEYVQDKPSA